MNLKFWTWFKKKPIQIPLPPDYVDDDEVENPFIIITMTPEGSVRSSCVFPDLPENMYEQSAAYFGRMLFLIHSGELLPVLQKGVANGGTEHGNSGFSHLVLKEMNRLLEMAAAKKAVEKTMPFIPARHSFGFNDAKREKKND